MSLTREEWLQMWEEIKVLERIIQKFAHPTSMAMKKITSIKSKIQSVVGQLE